MADEVIWERIIDRDKIAARKRRFQRFFFLPAAVIIVLVAIVSGVGNAIGVAGVLALVGLAWGNVVRYQSLSDEANPIMTYDGHRLKVGSGEVMIEDIKRYSTFATSMQTSVLGKYSRIEIGKVVFRLDEPGSRRDPRFVEFGWPNMGENGVASLADALEPIIGDRWVAPSDLVNEDEISPRSRRRPGLI